MMEFKALAWFGTLAGKAVLIGSLLAALGTARYLDKRNQQNIGAERAVKKIEKANEKATDLGKRAAEKSRAPAAPGRVQLPRDPTSRD